MVGSGLLDPLHARIDCASRIRRSPGNKRICTRDMKMFLTGIKLWRFGARTSTRRVWIRRRFMHAARDESGHKVTETVARGDRAQWIRQRARMSFPSSYGKPTRAVPRTCFRVRNVRLQPFESRRRKPSMYAPNCTTCMRVAQRLRIGGCGSRTHRAKAR